MMSLMVLVVMTLLGVTALQGTALQQQMATNQVVGQQAFQAAESGATRMFRDEDFLLEADEQIEGSASLGGGAPGADDEDGVNESGYEVEGDRTSESAAGRGEGQAIMGAACRKFHFELVSVGTTDSTHARSTVHQGVYRFICGADGGLRQTASSIASNGG